ncbi:putative leucine-rich repeat receptor-like serine/threonine-protein kinase BAM1 [Cocos nucifera]|uniref:Putative leucine-rich repeat receptor-like serine/threonine-protein kinase BAM1 n=1 Tax=Cocos nucifera TaxID=13894 RepID=A0A8K0HTH2_COCNU|nr:putative leucine-rich repeat receptor-like serine/threonine-protein kinase BAM1 [Cocos nucifera]
MVVEHRSLLDLKMVIGNPIGRDAVADHCHSWVSVACNATGHIVSLDISNLNLSGPIPPKLSLLSGLCYLNLSNNVFNGTFPSELSHLKNLRVLDLYNNNLTGILPIVATPPPLSSSLSLDSTDDRAVGKYILKPIIYVVND